MIELTPAVVSFIENVKKHQVLWGLADETGEGWVVCDSSEFDNTDVMPIWSLESAATSHCTEEWSEYKAVEISIDDFLEFWVGDLNEDGVLIGLDWVANEDCLEADPIELAKELVEIEAE